MVAEEPPQLSKDNNAVDSIQKSPKDRIVYAKGQSGWVRMVVAVRRRAVVVVGMSVSECGATDSRSGSRFERMTRRLTSVQRVIES